VNHLPQTERRVLDEAVETLSTQTGGVVKLLPRPRGRFDPRFDAQVELEPHGQKFRLLAEIKNVDRRPALAQIKEQLVTVLADQFPGYLPLLVAPYITEGMAEECPRIDLPFADTAFNLFLRTGTTLLYIIGRPDPIT